MNRLVVDADRRLHVVRAAAEQLPFADECVDLAYFHLSIHHTRWRAAIAEAVRVVKPGGVVEVITLGPAHHTQSNLAKWFPSVPELDVVRFPDPVVIATELGAYGALVDTSIEVQHKTPRARDWIAAVEARFVSTLQLLDDDEITTGLERMRDATPDLDGNLEYDMIWDRISARL